MKDPFELLQTYYLDLFSHKPHVNGQQLILYTQSVDLYFKAHNYLLVIAQVSVSSWHILVNDSYGLLQLPLVKCDALKQYLMMGGKRKDTYMWMYTFKYI